MYFPQVFRDQTKKVIFILLPKPFQFWILVDCKTLEDNSYIFNRLALSPQFMTFPLYSRLLIKWLKCLFPLTSTDLNLWKMNCSKKIKFWEKSISFLYIWSAKEPLCSWRKYDIIVYLANNLVLPTYNKYIFGKKVYINFNSSIIYLPFTSIVWHL